MMGFNALILTTVGAKSGAKRTNPVGWFPGHEGSWLIVASAAGAARNPAWYHNIAAHPDEVQIEMKGRTIPVAIRFDRFTLRRLKALAALRNTGYQTLLKEFVIERLYEEEKRVGIIAPHEGHDDDAVTAPSRR